MDSDSTLAPDAPDSLEAMVESSVSAQLDARIGHANSGIEAKVKAEIANTFDHILGDDGSKLQALVDASVDKAVTDRLSTAVLDASMLVHAVASGSTPAHGIVVRGSESPVDEIAQPQMQTLAGANQKATEGSFAGKSANGGLPLSKRAVLDKRMLTAGRIASQANEASLSNDVANESALCGMSAKDNVTLGDVSPFAEFARPGVAANAGCIDGAGTNRPGQGCNTGVNSAIGSAFLRPTTRELPSSSFLTGCAYPYNLGLPPAIDDEESLFLVDDGPITTPTRKRKESWTQTEGSTASSIAATPVPKKIRPSIETRWGPGAPGFTTGEMVDFLKVCDECPRDTKLRGYPRIVDLDNFTKESNKADMSMADVVATVLWKHDLKTLQAFLDFKNNPKFSFVRKESNTKKRDFAIERTHEVWESTVTIGYHARTPGYTWFEKYEYKIEGSRKWKPVFYTKGVHTEIKATKHIEELACIFGADIFARKIWNADNGVEFIVTKA